jgi:serine phosphatase RsbU (regulator of sigma subunit)/anti-sigma regulatory factor (Ser/Thr protein kinase)
LIVPVGEPLSTTHGSRLVLRNEFDELNRLASWLEEAVQRYSLNGSTSFAVRLCVDEAAANIITHNKDAKASRIVVTLQRQRDEFVVLIEDDGPPFDPTGVPPPEPGTTLETTKIGGLGVHLMRRFSTSMQYERIGEENSLRLTFPTGGNGEDDRTDKSGDADPTIFWLARSNRVLGRLSRPTLADLLDRGERLQFGPDQTLVRQGEHSDSAYLILAGDLDIQVNTAYGEVHLARISAGALIGEIGVFADLPRTATVRARSAVRALKFDRSLLLRAGESDPTLLRYVIKGLGRQIGNFNHAIGLYTNALTALERHDFDLRILDELLHPIPELVNFAQSFRRMAEQIVLRRSQHEEMASAAAIQRAMLPSALPADFGGGRFDIHADMRPAREVGGDLYDIFPLDGDRLVITIGDVSGKGVPAALFMAVTQTVIRLVVRDGRDLQTEIERANELLVADNREMMFATLFCGVLDASSGTLTYCNCGHNPPLVVREGSGRCERLHANSPPLGIEKDIAYQMQSVTLSSGDMVFLYTDGVTEAQNAEGVQFGMERLEQVTTAGSTPSARETVERVLHRVAEFSEGVSQFDDVTCVALKCGDRPQHGVSAAGS